MLATRPVVWRDVVFVATSTAAVAESMGTILETDKSHVFTSGPAPVAVVEALTDFVVETELCEILTPFVPAAESNVDPATPVPLGVAVAKGPVSKVRWATVAATIAL